jgi:decaprenylphospho-beta-D-erythro-pentofuranosid-2-ulose 2-reductase
MSGPRRVLICGATSAIASEAARCFAASRDLLFLAARNPEKLSAIADDLRVRGATRVETAVVDFNDTTRHQGLIEDCAQRLGGIDAVLIAHGTLPDQPTCQTSFEAARAELETNFLSVASLLTIVGNYCERQRSGAIAVISSVAGDRGRQSNYVYGAAKGAVSIFLQGLRNRLHPNGVRVITIKPGFVDTPMTTGIAKNFLWVDAATVGRGVYRAMSRGPDIAYLPWFWRPIMLLIRLVPERLFKRLRL